MVVNQNYKWLVFLALVLLCWAVVFGLMLDDVGFGQTGSLPDRSAPASPEESPATPAGTGASGGMALDAEPASPTSPDLGGTADLAGLTNQLTTLAEEQRVLSDRVGTMEATIQQFPSMGERMDAYDSSLAAAGVRLDTVEERLAGLDGVESRLDEMSGQFHRWQSKLETLEVRTEQTDFFSAVGVVFLLLLALVQQYRLRQARRRADELARDVFQLKRAFRQWRMLHNSAADQNGPSEESTPSMPVRILGQRVLP